MTPLSVKQKKEMMEKAKAKRNEIGPTNKESDPSILKIRTLKKRKTTTKG